MTLKPLNYNLTLTPDFKKFTFEGEEIITFEIDKHHQEIQLDCTDIAVKTCTLIVKNENLVKSFKENAHDEVFHIQFKNPLPQGKYALHITYTGNLNDKLKGFYRSSYIYKGQKEYVLTTQFEPTEARRAFPCVDHPSYKATFDVTFVIPKEYSAVSNMLPIKEKNLTSAIKSISFETTPVMSTYLLYFGIGKWEILERKAKSGLLLRGITTQEKSKYTEFALEVTEKCVDYFADYFDYPYILPKLDVLAIPDFATGAMENWGAITFIEILLLYYPGKTSKAIRERIAEVLCHEIAHQWFGNLVTMKWFDDIWLNESFATYMAFKALHHIFPHWDNWQNYVTDTVFDGMDLDSLYSTHPIHIHDVQTKDIDELFDEISYNKGGSILRMIEGYLGDNNFKKAIQRYIRRYQYQNTVARDLWNEFAEVQGDLTVEMIEKFILQPGFPLLNVNMQGRTLYLEQERFLFLGTDKNKLLWDIPVVLEFKDHSSKKIILTKKQAEIQVQKEIMTLNKNYTGFYVSNYDKDSYKAVGDNFSENTPQSKVGILHDLYYMVLAGENSLDAFLTFVEKHVFDDADPYITQYASSKLYRIFRLTKNAKSKILLEEIARKIIKRHGFHPDSEERLIVTTARNTGIASLILLQDEETERFVNKIFSDYLNNEATLHKDLKGVIFSSAVWINDKHYSIIHDLYRKKEIAEEKIKLLSALGNSQNPELVKKTLEYILTEEVRLTDYQYPILSASRNPVAQKVTYEWLVNKWGKILEKLGLMTVMYMRKTLRFIIPECAIGKEQEINQFLQEKKIDGLKKTYAQALEELEVNSRFVRNYSSNY